MNARRRWKEAKQSRLSGARRARATKHQAQLSPTAAKEAVAVCQCNTDYRAPLWPVNHRPQWLPCPRQHNLNTRHFHRRCSRLHHRHLKPYHLQLQSYCRYHPVCRRRFRLYIKLLRVLNRTISHIPVLFMEELGHFRHYRTRPLSPHQLLCLQLRQTHLQQFQPTHHPPLQVVIEHVPLISVQGTFYHVPTLPLFLSLLSISFLSFSLVPQSRCVLLSKVYLPENLC